MFVLSDTMYYKLFGAHAEYVGRMQCFEDRLLLLHLVQDEVLFGRYGYQQPRGDPDLFMAYLEEFESNMGALNQHWDFIFLKVIVFFLFFFLSPELGLCFLCFSRF